MQELGSNSKSDFKTYATWWHAIYTMHTIYRYSIPSTWEYETYYTYNSSARKEILHFYKETEAQTREADMEKFILTWEDNHMVETLLWVSTSYLSTHSPPGFFIATGSKILSLFPLCSISLGNLTHVHDINILMNTKSYSSPDFSF